MHYCTSCPKCSNCTICSFCKCFEGKFYSMNGQELLVLQYKEKKLTLLSSRLFVTNWSDKDEGFIVHELNSIWRKINKNEQDYLDNWLKGHPLYVYWISQNKSENNSIIDKLSKEEI